MTEDAILTESHLYYKYRPTIVCRTTPFPWAEHFNDGYA